MTHAELLARLRDRGLEASAWANGPGDTYSAHSHGYDKVLVAARGSITFHLVDMAQDVLLEVGERLDLPAGTMHAATVGRSGVTCLEAHLPAGTLTSPPQHLGATDW
ncbi:MAG: cupin [Candidatus Limnocylindrales bacterium]